MKVVFLLWHIHEDEALPGGEDSKLIGVYSSMPEAEKAKRRKLEYAGFKDHPDSFVIGEYELDKDYWTSGFVTVKH